MSLSYKVIQRGEPGVPGGGVKKYYAQAVATGEVDIEYLTKRIEKISTVSGADIRAVLYALTDVVPEELADGNIARIGDMGDFRLSLSSEGHDREEEVSSDSVRKTKVLFRPGKKFREMQHNLEYRKVEPAAP